MGEELSFDNILSENEVDNLFTEDSQKEETKKEETSASETEEKDTDKNKETTEVNPETLFETKDSPESVGGNKDKKEDSQDGSDTDTNKGSNSPKESFYSSIATALRDEGVLPDLDDDSLKKIKTPEDFAEAMENQVKARLDAKQKRIDEALTTGVDNSQVQEYESTISYLDSISDEHITDESEEGTNLRKQLIYQDFINRGFSQERAQRELEKSINAGTDVEDAKEALQSNKDFFKNSYQDILNEAKVSHEEEVKKRKEAQETMKSSVLDESKEIFPELKLTKQVRQRVLDNIMKPVYKDEDGNLYSSIQKYEMDHREDFIKKLGVLFTLTDGFKNLDNLVKEQAGKVTKRSVRELEHVLSNTSRDSQGNLKFMSGVESDDEDSVVNDHLKLDV